MKDIPYFKTWFIFFVIATIGGLAAGMGIGLVLGLVLAVMGFGDPAGNEFIYQAAGWLVGLPISYFAFRWAVREYVVKEFVEGYRRPEISDSNEVGKQ